MSERNPFKEIERYNENVRKSKEQANKEQQDDNDPEANRKSETEKLIDAKEEFNENPLKSTFAFLFPYFKLLSVTSVYFLICNAMYVVQWIMYLRYTWD